MTFMTTTAESVKMHDLVKLLEARQYQDAADYIEQLEREVKGWKDLYECAASKGKAQIAALSTLLAESQAREAQMRQYLNNIGFATSPKPDDGSSHENAYSLAVEALSIPTDDTALRQAIAKELREAADYADANNVCGNVSMDWLRRRSDELVNGK